MAFITSGDAKLWLTVAQVAHNVEFVAAFLLVDILQTTSVILTTTRDARTKKGRDSFFF